MKEIKFEKVLIIGPSSKRKGGIASVLKMYKKYIIKANYFASTKFQSTVLSFLFFIERIIALIWILILKEIKIVHIHGSSAGSFYRKYTIFLISRLFKKKVIYHIHSGRFDKFYENSNKLLKKCIKHLINNSDGIIVLSGQWKNYLQKKFKPKEIFVLGNMIPEPKKENQNTAEALKKPIKFAYLGKIFQPKGVYDLLDSIVENYSDYINKATFTFAGSGEEEKTKKYKELDPYNIINFVGWLDEEAKNNLLSCINVLILPSYSEGLPVSILEAMSYKKGIIATNVGGIPEIIKDKYNGIIISPGCKDDLHNAIMYYIKNTEDIVNHGANGYECVQNYFPKEIIKRLKLIYNSV